MSRLVEQIKRHEGLRLKPYNCSAGKLTIGYGRNLEDVGISEIEAERLLLNDITRVELLLYHVNWYKQLNTARQEVVVNMCFNLGFTRLCDFKRMIAAIERKDYKTAADEMLNSKWAQQVGERAKELAEIMHTGRWSE